MNTHHLQRSHVLLCLTSLCFQLFPSLTCAERITRLSSFRLRKENMYNARWKSVCVCVSAWCTCVGLRKCEFYVLCSGLVTAWTRAKCLWGEHTCYNLPGPQLSVAAEQSRAAAFDLRPGGAAGGCRGLGGGGVHASLREPHSLTERTSASDAFKAFTVLQHNIPAT